MKTIREEILDCKIRVDTERIILERDRMNMPPELEEIRMAKIVCLLEVAYWLALEMERPTLSVN